jgi:DNA-binding FrmR family transcriptional regulator
MLDADEKKALNKRLKRIAGQVAGLQRMLDEDRYCIDVVIQVSAARAALAKVGARVLERHFQTCLVHAFESGDKRDRDKKIEELMKVFERHGNV